MLLPRTARAHSGRALEGRWTGKMPSLLVKSPFDDSEINPHDHLRAAEVESSDLRFPSCVWVARPVHKSLSSVR